MILVFFNLPSSKNKVLMKTVFGAGKFVSINYPLISGTAIKG